MVMGMPHDEVRVEDRYRVGGALVEVSQPRNPCYKRGLALDEPAMPSRIVAAHRPGFSLRVLEEGDVGAGDSLELVARDPAALTVAAVSDLLWIAPRDPAALARAAALPALSKGWRASSTHAELIEARCHGK